MYIRCVILDPCLTPKDKWCFMGIKMKLQSYFRSRAQCSRQGLNVVTSCLWVSLRLNQPQIDQPTVENGRPAGSGGITAPLQFSFHIKAVSHLTHLISHGGWLQRFPTVAFCIREIVHIKASKFDLDTLRVWRSVALMAPHFMCYNAIEHKHRRLPVRFYWALN